MSSIDSSGVTVAVRGTVSGRVQGVGFRWFVVQSAERLGVSGWVRNLADGRVGFFAQGSAGAIADFRAAVATGPRSARVTAVSVDPAEPDMALSGFAVR